MNEQGKLIKVSKDGMATVRITRKEACGSCNMCAFKPDSPHMDFVVKNTLDAKVDDEVIVNMSGMNGLIVSLIVYLIPLVFAFIGLAIGMACKLNDYITILIFFGMLIIGLIPVNIIDRKLRKNKKVSPQMVEIVKNKENE